MSVRKLMLLIIVLTGWIKGNAQKYTAPYIAEQSNLNLFIASVELGDTTKIGMTVCNFTVDNYKFWFNPMSSKKAFYLENFTSGQKFKYLGESGYSSKSKPYRLVYEQCDTIFLYFEKVTNGARRFNLIEGSRNNSWDFKDLDLNKSFVNPVTNIVGKKCIYSDPITLSFGLFFTETYNRKYEGIIEELDYDKGRVKVKITNGYIRDPSWASINYLENRDQYAQEAERKIGTLEWKNAASVSLVIWPEE